MEVVQFEGVLAIFMIFAIPLFAIIFGTWSTVSRVKSQEELRKAIISSDLDAERINLLLKENERHTNKYSPLRWGSSLLGLGLGTLICYAFHLKPSGNAGMLFFCVLAAGCGFGLLISFIVEYRLRKLDKKK